jgi:putative ABC transport system permease protein
VNKPRRGLSAYKLLLRSLTYNRGRTAAELAALLVSAAAATALLTLYLSIDAKLHHEFRAFGANIIVTAKSPSQSLPADAMARIQGILGSHGFAVPAAYAVAQTSSGASIVVAGTDLQAARQMNTWWQIVGSLPQANSSPVNGLVGVRAHSILASRTFSLTYNGRTLPITMAGTLKTGDAADSRVYLPLPVFQAWTGLLPSTIEVESNGSPAAIQLLIQRLQAALPEAQVHPVHQLIEAEAGVVTRTRSLILSSLLLISLTVAICVLATLTAAVLERRRDFAIMKALGASGGRIGAIFFLETLTLAVLGAFGGYAAGSGIADLIGHWNFHTSIAPIGTVALQVLALNLLVALLAAAVPLETLRRVEPASLLRGE